MSLLTATSGVIGAVPVVGNVLSVVGGVGNLLGSIFGGGSSKSPLQIEVDRLNTEYNAYYNADGRGGQMPAGQTASSVKAWLTRFYQNEQEMMYQLTQNSALKDTSAAYAYTYQRMNKGYDTLSQETIAAHNSFSSTLNTITGGTGSGGSNYLIIGLLLALVGLMIYKISK